MKISEVKLNLQKIITNLNQLQALRDSLTQNNSASEIANIAMCKQSLEEAFTQFEGEHLQRIAAQIKRRKIRKARCTRKLKTKRNLQNSSSNTSQYDLPCNLSIPEHQPITILKKRELRSANKYLSFMDSLEMLHHLKGGADSCKLKESLSQIRTIWHSTAQKISAEKQNAASVENQWNQVLFGRNSEAELKYGLRDFIERRSIWDSYLVSENDLTGSHIPIGWACPREDVRPEWKEFQTSL